MRLGININFTPSVHADDHTFHKTNPVAIGPPMTSLTRNFHDKNTDPNAKSAKNRLRLLSATCIQETRTYISVIASVTVSGLIYKSHATTVA